MAAYFDRSREKALFPHSPLPLFRIKIQTEGLFYPLLKDPALISPKRNASIPELLKGICKNRFHSLDLPFFISYFHRQRHSSSLGCEPAFYRRRKKLRIQKDSFIFFIDFSACSKILISFLSPASLYRTVLFSLEIPPDI